MNYTKAELTAMLTIEDFPRSASYDPIWVLENLMGPNVLWLAESLSQVMDLQAGTRVLDLGCGKATSSIFLAREFQLQVWANPWLYPSDRSQKTMNMNNGIRSCRRGRFIAPTADLSAWEGHRRAIGR